MTQGENSYRQDVFLQDLRQQKDRQQHRIWAEHQQMQLSFLYKRGLTSSSTVLDLGCGPMRLGSVLIPLLKDGWYYGQDINPSTIIFGEEVLREAGISEQAPYSLFASDQFDLSLVDRPVQIAFSNSLFSHLTLNSILTALLQLQTVLDQSGVFYATFFALDPGRHWLKPHPRNKWGRQFDTYPHQDPYHYPLPLLQDLARQAGFYLDVLDDFGHPTQTMGRFRRSRWQHWFS
ncbi:class I SAM-dependent methyltransferase [Synechococcus sp. HIMB2401]|uniref:class I SAM-dependent methyltransferase n=1 Tax=Synechococcus sp. HIMB2401 TaxID=3144208 RepID=UPI0036F2480F